MKVIKVLLLALAALVVVIAVALFVASRTPSLSRYIIRLVNLG
jgi:hypothetical protein